MELCSDKQKQSAKGVTKFAQRNLTHKKYKETLLTRGVVRSNNTRIHSVNHNIHTIAVNKVSLSAYDNKRFIMSNGVDTLPFGHYSLREQLYERKIAADPNWEERTEMQDNSPFLIPSGTPTDGAGSPLSLIWVTPDPGFINLSILSRSWKTLPIGRSPQTISLRVTRLTMSLLYTKQTRATVTWFRRESE